MQFLSSVLPILLGGIIGYVTNDLAIKMLFRPYKPVYIGRFRLPFTPGIVARRQEELSVMLGREVEAQFFNKSDLEILFQSDVFSEAVADSIADFLYSKRTTLCLAMETLQAREGTGPAVETAKQALCGYICDALQDFDFAPLIAVAGGRCADSLPRSAKNALTVFAPSLSDAIKQDFRSDGRKIVETLLGKVLTDMGDHPVRDIIGGLFPDHGLLRDTLKELYRHFMAVYVRKVVGSIDVGGMITEKLRYMDPASIEKLILSVVRREFQYVVLLGGLLGMLIGAVNLLL